MKRFLACIMALVFVCAVTFTGCDDPNTDSVLTEFYKTNEKAVSEKFDKEETSFPLLTNYLKSWAKTNNLDVTKISDHYIVLTNPASEDQKKAKSTVLLCSVDPSDIEPYFETLVTAMTALIGPEEHGKIRLVISESDGGNYVGMNSIPKKYLKGKNLIDLRHSNSNNILTSGANLSSCTFVTNANTMSPQYSTAYEITMIIPEYEDPFNYSKSKNYPNPINVIGSLLASEKSSGKLFNIASFNYKGNDGHVPYSATATVVVDRNNVDSFMNKFDKSYSSMEKKFEKLESDFSYTITETSLPDEVLSSDVSNNLISLMYTLNTGICSQDEETGIVYTASYINSIATENGNLELKISIKSRSDEELQNLFAEYETTAGLCGAKVYTKDKGKTWTSKEDSKLVEFFTKAVPLDSEEDSSISIRSYETDIVASKHPKQNMIIYTFKNKSAETVMLNLVHFMDPNYVDPTEGYSK